MDFKVAGTRDGVTAMQVDTKTAGLSLELIRKALEQAKTARMQILDVIHETIPEPREALSQYAPRVFVVVINPDRIGDVIGPGGKIIKKIEAETGAKLDIEQDGHVYITSVDAAGGERAKQIVEDITREIKPGEVYTGKVVRIEAYGAFVEFLPGRDGMLHISQLAKERVNRVEDICNLGDEIQVRVLEIRDDGNIRLTRRGLTEDDQGYEPPPPEPRRESGGRGGGGGRPPFRSDRGPRRDAPRPDQDRGGDQGPKISFRPKR
jgi:polyribonucleotide nucleotidyltransferase